MGSYLLHLRRDSLRPPLIKRLSACFPTAIMSYNSQPSKESNGHRMERARTTAEEFERFSDELEKVAEAKARQGFASDQTIGKAHDGTQEAAVGDSGFESVNEKHKEEPVGKKGKSGNDQN